MQKKISLALLFVTILMIFMPMFLSVNTSALSLEDLDVKYTSTGISQGAAWTQNADQGSVWNTIFDEYKGIIVGVTGIGTLTMVILFILNFMKLGQAAGNPNKRQEALTGLLWTGIAAAGLGGVTIFVAVSTNLLTS